MMKKRLLAMCTLLALTLCLIPAAFAAAEQATEAGIYGIQTVAREAVLTPQTADNGAVQSKQVLIEEKQETLYPGAVRFALSFKASPGGMVFVRVVKDGTSENGNTIYVNQYTADGDGMVSCTGKKAPYPMQWANGSYSVYVGQEKIATFKYFSPGVEVKGVVKSFNSTNPTVELYKAGTQELAATATVSGSGTSGLITYSYSFASIPKGTYDLKISKDGQLKITITGVAVGDTALDLAADKNPAISEPELLAGDINNDDVINFDDLKILRSTTNYGKDTSDTGVDKNTDLNGDGTVNFDDLKMLRSTSHYGKVSAVIPFQSK